jgi:hypothetical protein
MGAGHLSQNLNSLQAAEQQQVLAAKYSCVVLYKLRVSKSCGSVVTAAA